MQATGILLFCISVYWVFTETSPAPRSQNVFVLKNQIIVLLQNNQHRFSDDVNITLPVNFSKECWKKDLEIFMNASAAVHKLNEDHYKSLGQAIYHNLRKILDSLLPAPQKYDCEDAIFPLTQYAQRLTSFLESIPFCLSKFSEN